MITRNMGTLWWLQSFKAGDTSNPAFFMTGNGGNKVLGFPTVDIAVVITSTNYNMPGMHEQTELLAKYVLTAVRQPITALDSQTVSGVLAG
jgi:hypothetical protein